MTAGPFKHSLVYVTDMHETDLILDQTTAQNIIENTEAIIQTLVIEKQRLALTSAGPPGDLCLHYSDCGGKGSQLPPPCDDHYPSNYTAVKW